MALSKTEILSDQINEYEREVANKLLSARLSNNIPLEDVAEKTGISEVVMLRYERATEVIPASDLFKIAGAVGVSIEYFFGEESHQDDAAVNLVKEGVFH
jgi:transcriptional regulator with XRE-family HTH domain